VSVGPTGFGPYRAAVDRAPSATQLQDDLLVAEAARLHAENCGVYGRIHGELDMHTPLEVEQAYCADLESAHPAPAGPASR